MKACRSSYGLFFLLSLVVPPSWARPNAADNFSGKILFPEGYPEKNNVVVYVDGTTAAPHQKQAVVVDQKDMQFIPFLTVATVGSQLTFRNLDAHLHTVKAETGPLKDMKLVMTPVRRQFERTLTGVGVSELLCDIHSQMRAFVVVVPNSLFAVSDEQGAFAFAAALPPFPFELKVWHEVLPGRSLTIGSPADLKNAKEITLKTWEQASR